MKTLSKAFKFLFTILVILNISLLGFVSYLLMNDNMGLNKAERINIVEKNGMGRIVISNAGLIPATSIKSRQYRGFIR